MSDSSKHDFEKAATERPPGLMRELLTLVRENKKWWLIPILLVLTLVGLLIMLSTTAAAPFIYSLF